MVSNIYRNIEEVRADVARAAEKAGRNPSEITIVAVTKTVPADIIAEALQAGIIDFGENRVQEGREKKVLLPPSATWHLIGSLQTNKVKAALETFDLIHSLDRWNLAAALGEQAGRLGREIPTLIQVNVSGELTKHGLNPEDVPEFVKRVSSLQWIRVHGLMTMAPFSTDPEQARPHFRRLRLLAREITAMGLPRVEMTHLSMGMSGDFEVAVEEGATIIRVGSAIFGSRA